MRSPLALADGSVHITLSTNGSTWEHNKAIMVDEGYDSNQLQQYMSVISGMIDGNTTFTHIKVTTFAEEGYTSNEIVMPIDFTIIKNGDILDIIATRNNDGDIEITLPADKESHQTYMYQILDSENNMIRSDIVVPTSTMWKNDRTILLPAFIVPHNDMKLKLAKITEGNLTGLTATPITQNGFEITRQ